MEQDQEPLVFPQNLVKMGKDLFVKFKRDPRLTIPVGAGIIALLHLLILTYLTGTCLVSLLPPFLMLAVFWNFDIKKARMLLVAGLVACTCVMLISTYFFAGMYGATEPSTAYSDDADHVLRDGTVDPFEGDALTEFNYTVEVHVNSTLTVHEVKVLILGLGHSTLRNESMLPGPSNTTGNVTVTEYHYVTTVSDPINQFAFLANVSGKWYTAADYSEGTEAGANGPIYQDDWEIAKVLLYYSATQAYLQFFIIFALLVGMIWWTRRARRMREQQLEKWEAKRKEAEEKAPKDEAKVPSLAKAMGLEADDTFVCSECGADVPSDASKCPKCGEKFD